MKKLPLPVSCPWGGPLCKGNSENYSQDEATWYKMAVGNSRIKFLVSKGAESGFEEGPWGLDHAILYNVFIGSF